MKFPDFSTLCSDLDYCQLGSGNVKSVNISSKAGKGLFRSIRSVYMSACVLWNRPCLGVPDERVDLDGVDIIELLQSLLDLSLVGLDVHNKYKGVVLLDLFHGTLGVERVDDDLVLIETRLRRNRLSGEFGLAGELKSLGSVEGGRETDLADLLRVSLDKKVRTKLR
jgi:hypothetical protein